jgi:hypothetical protein
MFQAAPSAPQDFPADAVGLGIEAKPGIRSLVLL